MKNAYRLSSTIVAIVLLCLFALPLNAGAQAATPAPDSLRTVIASLDATLFGAYNACDLKTLDALVDDNLEFYHDRDGLSVGKTIFLQKTKMNICGKIQRDLVPGTMQVYELKGYGALEMGVHRFRHPGSDAQPLGEAKFVILWQNIGGTWKLARVISYDHAEI